MREKERENILYLGEQKNIT